MLAGDTWRAREPFEMKSALDAFPSASGRSTIALIDDKYPSRKGTRNEWRQTSALRRNEQTEGRKPVLIDEMLERHRRRMDGVIDVMDALLVRRIDAERMQSGPVLRGRNDLALRERARQAPFIGDDRQIRRLVEGDPNALAGHRQRVAQTAPESSAMACERRLARLHAAID